MAGKKSSIDTDLIRDLAEIMSENDLSEFELEDGDLTIRLARGSSAPVYAAPQMMPAPAAAPSSAPAAAPTPAEAPAAAAPSGTPVTSPMVGTAYLSPAPNAAVFVKVGDTVKKGQTILIVEAMKTMNQIPSSADGVVASINVEDGQPVEFGETLITLK